MSNVSVIDWGGASPRAGKCKSGTLSRSQSGRSLAGRDSSPIAVRRFERHRRTWHFGSPAGGLAQTATPVLQAKSALRSPASLRNSDGSSRQENGPVSPVKVVVVDVPADAWYPADGRSPASSPGSPSAGQSPRLAGIFTEAGARVRGWAGSLGRGRGRTTRPAAPSEAACDALAIQEPGLSDVALDEPKKVMRKQRSVTLSPSFERKFRAAQSAASPRLSPTSQGAAAGTAAAAAAVSSEAATQAATASIYQWAEEWSSKWKEKAGEMKQWGYSLMQEQAKRALVELGAPILSSVLSNLKHVIKSSALADPDMWQCVRRVLADELDRFLADVEHEIENSMEAALSRQYSNKAAKGPEGRAIFAWYYKLRAFTLHHYLPHDRTIFGKLKDPIYVVIMTVTLLPVHVIRTAFFAVLLLMLSVPGPPDEFQLVNFVLAFKGTQFLNAGLLMTIRGAAEYFACFTWHKEDVLHCIETTGPGSEDSLQLGLIDYLGSCLLVWIAFCLLPHSRKHVIHGRIVTNLNAQNEDPGPRTGKLLGRPPSAVGKGGRLGKLLRYDIKCFTASLSMLVTLAVWTWTADAQAVSFLDWLLRSPQFRADVFWCKVLYGLLSLPFFPFTISILCKVLTHCEWTGFNEHGACVAFDLSAGPTEGASSWAASPAGRAFAKAVRRYGTTRVPLAP